MPLSIFLRCKRYGRADRLAQSPMIFGCSGSGALFYVPLRLLKSWYTLEIRRLTWNIAMYLVLALFTIERLTETYCKALQDQELFPHNTDESKIMVLPAKPPLIRRSASGAKCVNARNQKLNRGIDRSLQIA